MSKPEKNKSEDVERGVAEEAGEASLTEMEREVSRPPEERWSGHTEGDVAR